MLRLSCMILISCLFTTATAIRMQHQETPSLKEDSSIELFPMGQNEEEPAMIGTEKGQEKVAQLLIDAVHTQMEHLRQKQLHRTPRTRTCICSATNLNWDVNRVLDWIAYHNLHGVDCFTLTLDIEKTDFNQTNVLDVYRRLQTSSLVTLINSTYLERIQSDRKGPKVDLSQKASMFPDDMKYLAVVDTDEYLVFHRTNTTSDSFPQITEYLDHEVANVSMGLYIDRWDYGTSGHKTAPDYHEKPEIAYFDHRAAAHRYGRGWWGQYRKFILNFPLAVRHRVKLHGSHRVQVWSKYVPQMKNPQDSLTINHYVTASTAECIKKGTEGDGSYHRNRLTECDATELNDVEDRVLVDFADATRARRSKLFP